MPGIRLTINDRAVEVHDAPPTTTLLEYLRGPLRLTGTKEGCAEGDCGACTVAILDPLAAGGPTWRAVNSCLVLLPSLHGRRVVTVEGLRQGADHHPAQEAIVRHLGSQCGYCTPGVVMSMFEATYRSDLDAPWKLDDQMCGNLCRCTGYRAIRDATAEVAGTRPDDAFARALAEPTEPDAPLTYEASEQRWIAPVTLTELVAAVAGHPEHRLIGGSTDLGLDVTKRHTAFSCLISIERVPQLRALEADATTVRIGAGVRLADLEAWCPPYLPALARMLRYFGSRQIKHRATLGGNLCNASPIGDLAPVLLAHDAVAVVASSRGERTLRLQDFFPSYRVTALAPDEVLVRVEVPRPDPADRIGAYKVSKRRELDISAVAGCFRVRVEGSAVAEIRLAYGGMAATPARAAATESALLGGPWTEAAVLAATEQLAVDFTPLTDHRGSAWYRAAVARNLLYGFFLETLGAAMPRLPDQHPGTVVLGARGGGK